MKAESGFYDQIEFGDKEFDAILNSAIPLKVTGVVRPADGSEFTPLSEPIGYTRDLTEYLISYAEASDLIKDQMASPDNSVINGAKFSPSDDAAKIEDCKNYLSKISTKEKADILRDMMSMYGGANDDEMLNMSDVELAQMMDMYLSQAGEDMDEQLLMIYDSYIAVGTFEENLESFGYVNRDTPTAINIYADSFQGKEGITDSIDKYNETAAEGDQITYTDYIGLLLSSVTTIVNVISYVLIAFVAVSLVVSSIMIGIITYISVLERTKEIGILRAIGASKRNISQVFNAETFIIGFLAGVLGIVVTLLLLIPGNMIIHSIAGSTDVNASLPIVGAIVLIALSTILTLIGGFIPSKKAAKKDPVAALRSE